MTFITRLNKNCTVLPSQTSAPKIHFCIPCDPMTCMSTMHWSSDFFSWTPAQPNLGFGWCWALTRVAWPKASVTTSSETKYPPAHLPDTKPGFGKRQKPADNRAKVILPSSDLCAKGLWWGVGMNFGLGHAGKPWKSWDLLTGWPFTTATISVFNHLLPLFY